MCSVNDDIELNKQSLKAPQLLVEDTTSEKLEEIMARNDEYAFSVTAEGKTILQNLCGCYGEKDKRLAQDSIYLRAFSGDHIRTDRLSRDGVKLEEPCLVCHWMMQPSIFRTLLRTRELIEDGLLPRFLLCVSSDQIPEYNPDNSGLNQETTNKWAKLCNEILTTYYQATAFFTIDFPRDVLMKFVHFKNAAIRHMNNGLTDVQSFVARWAELSFRIALVLHLAKYSSQSHKHQLDLATAEAAIEIMQYYAVIQQNLLFPKSEDDSFYKAKRLADYLIQRCDGTSTVREVSRSRSMKSSEIETLAEKFPRILRIEDLPTVKGGTPKRMISTPKLL